MGFFPIRSRASIPTFCSSSQSATANIPSIALTNDGPHSS